MRPFEIHGIAQLPHLSRAIYNDFVEPPVNSLLTAAQQAHIRRELQPTVMRNLIQRLDYALD